MPRARPAATSAPNDDPDSTNTCPQRGPAAVAIRLAAAQTQAEQRHHRGLQITDDGYERESCGDERPGADERRCAAARAAAPQRTGNDRRRAEAAEGAADGASDRFVP